MPLVRRMRGVVVIALPWLSSSALSSAPQPPRLSAKAAAAAAAAGAAAAPYGDDNGDGDEENAASARRRPLSSRVSRDHPIAFASSLDDDGGPDPSRWSTSRRPRDESDGGRDGGSPSPKWRQQEQREQREQQQQQQQQQQRGDQQRQQRPPYAEADHLDQWQAMREAGEAAMGRVTPGLEAEAAAEVGGPPSRS